MLTQTTSENHLCLAHQIQISLAFTHVRSFYLTCPYQLVEKIKTNSHTSSARTFICDLIVMLTINAPIAKKVVCFSQLLKCLRSLYGKQCGPRSDCSYLFCVHAVCFYTEFVSNVRQLFAADNFSRRHFQMHFFLDALRVKLLGKKYNSLLKNFPQKNTQYSIHQ